MPKATLNGGPLTPISNCWIKVPMQSGGTHDIVMDNLPDISDSKSASYNDEPIIGRSQPLKTYSHSDNRSISIQIHLFVTSADDVQGNLQHLRALESAVYPRDNMGNAPFYPPPVCQIQCGYLLGEYPLCVVLKQYSVKFPTDVAWDEDFYTPWKFDIDTTWDVVYSSTDLPGQDRILNYGV